MAQILGHKLDANTVGLWRLDETAASQSAIDQTGRYGMSLSNPAPVAVGKVGGGRVTATSTTQSAFATTVNVNDAAMNAAILSGNWTVEDWFSIDPAITGNTFPFNNHNGTMLAWLGATRGLLVGCGNAGGWRVFSGGGAVALSGAGWSSLSRGVFHHVAFRSTATSSTQAVIDVFVDGVKVATSAAAYTLLTTIVAGVAQLGGEGTQFDTFVGTMDDVRLSSVARTDAEIADSFWRGVIDTTPSPITAPYRQQSRTVYQDYQRQLSPTALLQPNGAAFEAGLGSAKDALLDRCLQAVKVKYPSVAPADALAAIGAERGMPRGGTESDATYAARLLNAWNVWPWAGTAYGLLQALYSTGYQNVVLAQVRGGLQFTLDNGGVNLLRWSNQFNPTAGVWVTNQSYTVAPVLAADGTLSATTLTAGATQGGPFQNLTAPVSGAYTLSISAQSAAGNQFFIRVRDNTTTAHGLSTTFTGLSAWTRFSIQVTLDAGDSIDVLFGVSTSGQSVNFADAVLEPAVAPGPIARTYNVAKPTAQPAGTWLSSALPNGLWETDVLSSLSPVNQSFWSKFDVLFPLPLQAPSFSWSGGVPSSTSTEANFIRALIQAWKPAHATCNRIVIQQSGKMLGYPATATLGASNGVLGGTTIVWTP